MTYIYLSEKEIIQQELEELRFHGEVLEIEPDDNAISGSILIQPSEEYYELLRRLREIDRKEEPQDIFVI